ncbi:MAG: 1,4-dihydroxy-6-naphthoate synthase [Rikenellaceae bacterium]
MKLYISPCPNDTFMFDALVNGRIDTEGLDLEVSYFDIEELNSRAISCEAEFSKISCAIIPQIANNYTISRSGAALGRGNGPLFVKRKGDNSPIKRIAIPGLHTTANLLISKLFPEITERTPMLFSTIATAIENNEVDAGVLIHEGRFLYAQRNLELVADLGVLWEAHTSLPLPLGAIAIRKDVDAQTADKFQRLLAKSIEFAFANPSLSRNYIKQHAQEMEDSVIDSHIALFVNEYSRELGTEGYRAIEELSKP